MTPDEVKAELARLRAERGNPADKEITIPGKGHWLWGLYLAKYCGKHVP
jgi:hypothetical protein